MKKLILPLLLFVTSLSYAQVFVGKTDINNRYLHYVEIWDKPVKDIGKSYAIIDYGQMGEIANEKGTQNWAITNRNGSPLEFNGIVDVLNYMYRNGWEVMSSKTTDRYESFMLKRRDGYVQSAGGISKN